MCVIVCVCVFIALLSFALGAEIALILVKQPSLNEEIDRTKREFDLAVLIVYSAIASLLGFALSSLLPQPISQFCFAGAFAALTLWALSFYLDCKKDRGFR